MFTRTTFQVDQIVVEPVVALAFLCCLVQEEILAIIAIQAAGSFVTVGASWNERGAISTVSMDFVEQITSFALSAN